MHRGLGRVVPLLFALTTGSCGEATGPGGAPPDPPPPGGGGPTAVALSISAPSILIVNEAALITVTARTAAGDPVALPGPLSIASSDPVTVFYSASGVVEGRRRGRATITASAGNLTATAAIDVRARVRLDPGVDVLGSLESWPLSPGDTLQLQLLLLDIDGRIIDTAAAPVWTSTDFAAVKVSPEGTVVALQPAPLVTIMASIPDGQAEADVSVAVIPPGPAAVLRVAHTVAGAGPITFTPNRGDPVTLLFGESVEREVPPGLLLVRTPRNPSASPEEEIWTTFAGVVQSGDRLSLYATGDGPRRFLSRAWTTPDAIAPDSGHVRFVQSSGFGVVYVQVGGAPVEGPVLCYFDPLDVSGYFRVAAGAFGVFLQAKYSEAPPLIQLDGSAAAGQAVTLVLTGDTPENAGFLTFPDF